MASATARVETSNASLTRARRRCATTCLAFDNSRPSRRRSALSTSSKNQMTIGGAAVRSAASGKASLTSKTRSSSCTSSCVVAQSSSLLEKSGRRSKNLRADGKALIDHFGDHGRQEHPLARRGRVLAGWADVLAERLGGT